MASFSSETKSKPRPLMLKDFLRDDPNSLSNDFHSFPRRSDTTVRKLLEIDLNSGDVFRETRLSRRRSRTNTISAFQKASEAVINAVKQFPFSSAKSPPKQGFLPRSFSQTLRRSFRKKNEKEKREIRARVRVRDIIRWKSFRDEEKKIKHLPCSISGGGSSSSWNESDFTSDFSSDCSVENDGKKHLPKKTGSVGEDSMETATCYGQPKVKQWKEEESKGQLESTYEEEEQLSPVSVLDFSYEDEEIETPSSSSFEDSLDNMERTKQHLLQKISRFECLAQMDPVDLEKRIAQSELEEEAAEEVIQAEDKAGDLLQLLKASSEKRHTRNTDKLLLDFFREELATSQRNLIRQPDAKAVDGIEEKLLSAASDWMNGYEELEGGLQDNREACREMTRDNRWRGFKEEEEELAMEMESGVLGSLVEELLLDLFH